MVIFIIKAFNYRIKQFISYDNFFKIKELYLEVDGKVIEAEKIADYLDFAQTKNIFEIEPRSLYKQILSRHPEVLTVKVIKRPPSRLAIIVKNRKPFLQVKLGQYYPLDQSGFVLPFPSNFRLQKLPLVIGLSPQDLTVGKQCNSPKLIKAIRIIRLLKNKFRLNYIKFDLDVSDEANILLYIDGIEIRMGREHFDEKLKKLVQILNDIERKGLQPKFIDLRFDKAVIGPG